METPGKDDNLELPGDPGLGSEHSEGYYEAHAENSERDITKEEKEPEIIKEEPVDQTEVNNNRDQLIKRIVRKKTIRSFIIFGLAFTLFIAGFIWILKSPEKDGIYKPLRKVLGFNEKINKQFFKETHLAPQYPKSAAVTTPRVNGDVGMGNDFDTSEWALNVVNVDKKDTIQLTLNDIKKLP